MHERKITRAKLIVLTIQLNMVYLALQNINIQLEPKRDARFLD